MPRSLVIPSSAAFVFFAVISCSVPKPMPLPSSPVANDRTDHHSFANSSEIRVTHADLDLTLSFEKQVIEGTAELKLQRQGTAQPRKVILDTRALTILAAEQARTTGNFQKTSFQLGAPDPVLGAPLSVSIVPETERIRITYRTSPHASGLQWLSPPQTAGKKHPFLYSQSQAIHARSWIPLQDSPGVRITYTARIRTSQHLLARMGASQDSNPPRTGEYRFTMPQAIPPYLIALAVGDLVFHPLGPRSGIYAEPPVADAAAREFADTGRMMEAAEALYGPYRWDRYDILVLPPSFPFGGMENPRLTFATPTVIAGDKSLVNLVAHELAHSWSGNLVTNATWRDFWLNEGFTVYIEQRIQEQLYGPARASMEAALELQELRREMASLPPSDQLLYINLTGRDPDDGATLVPYIKGALFLKQLEARFGRARFDAFLRSYFDTFAFQSITTADFVDYLSRNLLATDAAAARGLSLADWLTRPGLPESAVLPVSDAFEKVEAHAQAWLAGQTALNTLPVRDWSTAEWLHFLRSLPASLTPEQMSQLDAAFSFTRSGNAEILQQWLLMSIRSGYRPAGAQLEKFLTTVGRRKYIKPLYEELVKSPQGRARAQAIYRKARPQYHPIAVSTIDGIVKQKP